MHCLSLANLAANPYRTLGLSGAANQDEIDLAARRSRLLCDSSLVQTSPWDLPNLGPINRSRTAIEQAVARLYSPALRIQDRLIWYAGPALPGEIRGGAPAAESFPAAHDAAIAALHRAWISDPEARKMPLWTDVWDRLSQLVDSMDFLDWNLRLECDGNFEKRASIEEIGAATSELLPALSMALVPIGMSAFNCGDAVSAEALLKLLARDNSHRHAGAEKLLDEIEESLDARRRAADAKLRDKLRTNPDSPADWYIGNRLETFFVDEAYKTVFAPTLQRLFNLLKPADTDRRERLEKNWASLLELVALGWEWGNDLLQAEASLLAARNLITTDAPARVSIEQSLGRISPLAEGQRQRRRIAAYN